jgi:hypothetical protein
LCRLRSIGGTLDSAGRCDRIGVVCERVGPARKRVPKDEIGSSRPTVIFTLRLVIGVCDGGVLRFDDNPD